MPSWNDELNDAQPGRRNGRRKRKRHSTRRKLFFERLAQRRVLAVITGTVFEDIDYSLRQEEGEENLPSRLVYLDTNHSGEIETGEPFAVADESGAFKIEGVPDGTYALRLYDGSMTQTQVFPFEANQGSPLVEMTGGIDLVREGDKTFASTATGIVVGDVPTGEKRTAELGAFVNEIHLLGGGGVLAVTSAGGGATAQIVDADGNVSTLPTNVPWSDVAIGQDGTGLLIEETQQATASIQTIDTTDWKESVPVVDSGFSVPSDTQAISSPTGNRSVLAWAGSDGLELSLWSNSTATWITDAPVEINGTSQLLAFDDASGLLALRTDDGGVSIQDADAQFATLLTIDDVSGDVAIDGERELLMTIPSGTEILELYDLRNGDQLAKVPVDLTEIGSIAAITLSPQEDGPQALTVLGDLGNAEIDLSQPAAHQIIITDNVDPEPVKFAVQLDGDNTPAPDPGTLEYQINEDERINHVAPGVLFGIEDVELDQVVALPLTFPANGNAFLEVNGGFHYTPNPDFFGGDQMIVMFHDGRDVTEPIVIQITIAPLADPPTGIDADLDDLPENAPGPIDLGNFNIIDPDLNDNFQIIVSDDRFGIQNGHLIFLDGIVNFEEEDFIPISVEVIDTELQESITEDFEIFVLDENDPITAIHPDEATVSENANGESVAMLSVSDEDAQTHTYTVDDERFIIRENELLLAPGVSLDFESTPEVFVNITAREVGAGGSLTESLKISVQDVAEPVVSIELSGDSVPEFEHGAEVGTVNINGVTAPSNYTAEVDDPRFEIRDGMLKLLDNEYVRRADIDEIQLTITAQGVTGEFPAAQEIFIISVVHNPTAFHNDDEPYDVDDNGGVSALDALIVINYLNEFGPGPVGHGDPANGYDVNLDGSVSALDALLVINELNRLNTATTGVDAEPPEGELPAPGVGSDDDRDDVSDNDPLKSEGPVAHPLDAEASTGGVTGHGADEVFGRWDSTMVASTEDEDEDGDSASDETLTLFTDDNQAQDS